MHPPTISARMTPINHCALRIAATKNNPPAIAAIPALNPSMLSMKFIALVIATIHMIVSTMLSQLPPAGPSSMVSSLVSKTMVKMIAGISMMISLDHAPIGRRSSMSPSRCNPMTHPSKPHPSPTRDCRSVHTDWMGSSAPVNASDSRNDTASSPTSIGSQIARTIPMPPVLGMRLGAVFTCPSIGAESNAPSFVPTFSATHVPIRESSVATTQRMRSNVTMDRV